MTAPHEFLADSVRLLFDLEHHEKIRIVARDIVYAAELITKGLVQARNYGEGIYISRRSGE